MLRDIHNNVKRLRAQGFVVNSNWVDGGSDFVNSYQVLPTDWPERRTFGFVLIARSESFEESLDFNILLTLVREQLRESVHGEDHPPSLTEVFNSAQGRRELACYLEIGMAPKDIEDFLADLQVSLNRENLRGPARMEWLLEMAQDFVSTEKPKEPKRPPPTLWEFLEKNHLE